MRAKLPFLSFSGTLIPLEIINTSIYPNEEIVDTLNFVEIPIEARGDVEVHIKNCRCGYRGRIYFEAHQQWFTRGYGHRHYLSHKRFLITLGIADHYPMRGHYARYKTAPHYVLNSWKECLVTVFAHEVAHLRQYLGKAAKSEVGAEEEAVRALQMFRAMTAEPVATPSRA